jgi:hypothetical protein
VTTLAFDNELLELSRIVLERAGFTTEALVLSPSEGGDQQSLLPATRLLIAHDRFFIVAVGAAPSLDELMALEPQAVEELSRRVAVSTLGAKQWDLYLVLLANQLAPDDGRTSSELVTINYNTRLVRRIAHAGVLATVEAIERVLRPFLPLPQTRDSAVLEDALLLLERELPLHGVDEGLAGRAIAAFRDSGSLSSV